MYGRRVGAQMVIGRNLFFTGNAFFRGNSGELAQSCHHFLFKFAEFAFDFVRDFLCEFRAADGFNDERAHDERHVDALIMRFKEELSLVGVQAVVAFQVGT